jgi:hypothetical protein
MDMHFRRYLGKITDSFTLLQRAERVDWEVPEGGL